MLKFAVGLWATDLYGSRYNDVSRFRESAPSSSVCRVSYTQRNSARLQEATTSSRVIAAPPGNSATLQPNSKHRETTFGIDEDCWRSGSATMLMNGKPQLAVGSSSTSTVTAIHHLNGANGHHQSVCRKNINNASNTPVSNGFASGSTVNRFVPNDSIGGSPLRGHSPRTIPNGKLQNGGSPQSSLASYSSYGSIVNQTNGYSPTYIRRSPRQSSSPISEDCLVVIRMRADAQGRYGFNVKGGTDQNYPVIVSRVASGSSADKCNPRLNEGDQVLLINGMDVSSMPHEKVVRFIRATRDSPKGELVLTIKPNVYRCGEDLEESDAQYLPEVPHVADTVPRSDKLSQSLIMLKESLSSGKIITQFEQLYRKKPGLAMEDCKLLLNINKNRYRDVCPYDSTRVKISAPSGDYINASFVNMEIPSSGIVNRYIAAQGPLAHTSGDFWYMVWEQLCTTIVMLTTTVERGRIKCHQYWPRLYESHEYGRLKISCISERETANCIYREISIEDKVIKEERRVSQMQYTAWPDHGVPNDPKHFIDFVDEVRRARAGSVDPIVVHCSAGIGRTGVLILMETAACLVEGNEPVYPLDIVRTMREQRAMLIQTPGQYTFVCECILRAYHDGLIKPLAEYYMRSS
ncbi:Tyrosine-protein phosphatase [Dirofilaria immitis]